MNAGTVNKFLGSALAALLVIFGSRELVNETLDVEGPEKPGFEVAIATEAEASTGKSEPVAEAPIGPLLATATAEAGLKVAKPCLNCHTFTKGGANKVGPNIFGIVNRAVGKVAGYAYSKAMTTKGGDWSYDELAKYLANPKTYIPGNKMAFAGVKKPEDRANLIAYLRSLADAPAPLP